ncbi:hypothetical protein DH2020_028959 [Rehmannia glutinosa]|uniref:Leucine-rich repeat-containing N-terminal plant-type domain-containing protein n=1 Tax=Rehmannia glutinosa TaxID=99300 RepID=A0ABR0VSN7_REHGL
MMSSAIHLSIVLLIMASMICCVAKNITFGCVPRERKALLKFKASLLDHSNRLSSWKQNKDCCTWQGVKCSKVMGHVIGLDLRNRNTLFDIDNMSQYGNKRFDYMLQGKKIDSSLLELKYPSYLDLSWNDFQRSKIPTFFGSMKHLQHLNLSTANFVGVVPHQLGNLSSLRVLDLVVREARLSMTSCGLLIFHC